MTTNRDTCGQLLADHDPAWCFEIPARPTTDEEFAALPVLDLDHFHREQQ